MVIARSDGDDGRAASPSTIWTEAMVGFRYVRRVPPYNDDIDDEDET